MTDGPERGHGMRLLCHGAVHWSYGSIETTDAETEIERQGGADTALAAGPSRKLIMTRPVSCRSLDARLNK